MVLMGLRDCGAGYGINVVGGGDGGVGGGLMGWRGRGWMWVRG